MIIREDDHGLLVVCDGGVYRPQPSKHSYNYPEFETALTVGPTTGNHIRGTPHAKVGGEIWSKHGDSPEIMRLKGFPTSRFSWNPKV